MKRIKILIAIIILFTTVYSCKPRIDMDMSQWGDKAFITNVQLFAQEVKGDFKLAEFYENNGQLSTGIRRVIMTGTTVTPNNNTFEVIVKIPPGNDLTKAGLIISHTGTKVEPLNGSPVAGMIVDLTAKSFLYRVSSANGVSHDWKIIIQ